MPMITLQQLELIKKRIRSCSGINVNSDYSGTFSLHDAQFPSGNHFVVFIFATSTAHIQESPSAAVAKQCVDTRV